MQMDSPAMCIGIVECRSVSVNQILDENCCVVPRLVHWLPEENLSHNWITEEQLGRVNLRLVLLILFVERESSTCKYRFSDVVWIRSIVSANEK